MKLDEPARDVEPEARRIGHPRSVVLRRPRVDKRIEHASSIFFRNTRATVAHAHPRPAAREQLLGSLINANGDLARLGR